MTNLDTMWIRLAEHQPIADERGYGKKWKRMCEERTPKAAEAAAREAREAWEEAREAWAAGAAYAANAAWAARAAASAAYSAAEAICFINKAENI